MVIVIVSFKLFPWQIISLGGGLKNIKLVFWVYFVVMLKSQYIINCTCGRYLPNAIFNMFAAVFRSSNHLDSSITDEVSIFETCMYGASNFSMFNTGILMHFNCCIQCKRNKEKLNIIPWQIISLGGGLKNIKLVF
jgi:hypothetical protein